MGTVRKLLVQLWLLPMGPGALAGGLPGSRAYRVPRAYVRTHTDHCPGYCSYSNAGANRHFHSSAYNGPHVDFCSDFHESPISAAAHTAANSDVNTISNRHTHAVASTNPCAYADRHGCSHACSHFYSNSDTCSHANSYAVASANSDTCSHTNPHRLSSADAHLAIPNSDTSGIFDTLPEV